MAAGPRVGRRACSAWRGASHKLRRPPQPCPAAAGEVTCARSTTSASPGCCRCRCRRCCPCSCPACCGPPASAPAAACRCRMLPAPPASAAAAASAVAVAVAAGCCSSLEAVSAQQPSRQARPSGQNAAAGTQSQHAKTQNAALVRACWASPAAPLPPFPLPPTREALQYGSVCRVLLPQHAPQQQRGGGFIPQLHGRHHAADQLVVLLAEATVCAQRPLPRGQAGLHEELRGGHGSTAAAVCAGCNGQPPEPRVRPRASVVANQGSHPTFLN